MQDRRSARRRCPLSPTLLIPLAVAPALAPAALAQEPGRTGPQEITDRVFWDEVGPGGALSGGSRLLVVPDRSTIDTVRPAPAVTIHGAAVPAPAPGVIVDPDSRVDLVYVGDGYQAHELDVFHEHVDASVAAFFEPRPFNRYADYFRVHRVDVVSPESGVDNDPGQGVSRDTALDMGFWCSGIERLLCANVGKAYQFAGNAPDVDLVAALANSTKYGGAGYSSSDLGTASGGNAASQDVMIHEFGHALGNLADEYFTPGTTYTGAERFEPNVSIHDAATMATMGVKWARWMGETGVAFDGLHDTFEGARYNEVGIYRPTGNSMMRSLGRKFNRPSVEALVIEIYKLVNPIEGASDPALAYTEADTLEILPLEPIGHPLFIRWLLDGAPIAGASGPRLALCSIGMTAGPHTVSVVVIDNTAWVRDEAARAQWLTRRIDYQVRSSGAQSMQRVCVGAPNSTGGGATILGSGSSSIAADDLVLDVAGLPPGTQGIFFLGSPGSQLPMGAGFRCATAPLRRLGGVQQVDALGRAHADVDLASLPGNPPITPGDVRLFQFWYRDAAGGGSRFNVSEALEVRFCP